MRHWQQGVSFSRNRKLRREAMLRRLDHARAAKARKHQEQVAVGWTPEPKMERFHPLSFAVRDDINREESGWIKLRSVRDAARRLAVVLKHYQAGIKTISPPPEDLPSSALENPPAP